MGNARIAAARLAGSVTIIAAAVLSGGGSAFALEYGGFGGRPAYPRAENPRTESIFVHTLAPGAVQPEGVLVVNNASVEKTMLVYAVDSTPSTGGAFACAQASDMREDVGAWIALAKGEVTLAPGSDEVVPFTITVPTTADVGEHNGCIVMQEKKEGTKTGSGVSLSFRTGLRVAITVPGTLVRKLEIAGFTVTPGSGEYILRPLVKNTGNVSIDANARVITRYFFGLTHRVHGGEYPILRGETSDWNFELAKPFWGGWYRSSFVVEYDEHPEAGVGVQSGKALTRIQGPTVWFFSAPTIPGLMIEIVTLLLIAAIVALIVFARKRAQWIKNDWIAYEVRSGEDITALAQRFAVSWKLLARVNNLRPPYALAPKTEIKVPPTK